MSLKDALAAKKSRDTDQKTAAIADVTKEPLKRLNVNLPESVMKQFKAKAAMEKVRRRLRSVDDGDRQMVSILACVLTDGLAAVGDGLTDSRRKRRSPWSVGAKR